MSAQESELGVLAKSLLLRAEDYWVGLAAYVDESGTHDDSLMYVVAALVSRVKKWEALDRQWRLLLDRHRIPDFHTSDCAHGYRHFEGWEPKRRSDLYKKFVQLVCRQVEYRTWTAIVRPEFMQLYRNNPKEDGQRLAYLIGVTGCASRVLQLAKAKDTNIPWVFERGAKGSGYIVGVLQQMIEDGQADFYRMRTVTFGKRPSLTMLQAADLHAYEIYKHYSDQLSGRTGPDQIRRSLSELMHINEAGGGGYLFGAEKLNRWMEGIKNQERPINIAVNPLTHSTRTVLGAIRSA